MDNKVHLTLYGPRPLSNNPDTRAGIAFYYENPRDFLKNLRESLMSIYRHEIIRMNDYIKKLDIEEKMFDMDLRVVEHQTSEE